MLLPGYECSPQYALSILWMTLCLHIRFSGFNEEESSIVIAEMVAANEILTSIDRFTIQQYNQFIVLYMGPLPHTAG